MSETNGKDRLQRLEASHIKLMTEHELFVKEQERAWERNQQSWDRHADWLRQYEAQRQEDRERGAKLDERIDKLVGGIGEFIRQSGSANPR